MVSQQITVNRFLDICQGLRYVSATDNIDKVQHKQSLFLYLVFFHLMYINHWITGKREKRISANSHWPKWNREPLNSEYRLLTTELRAPRYHFISLLQLIKNMSISIKSLCSSYYCCTNSFKKVLTQVLGRLRSH